MISPQLLRLGCRLRLALARIGLVNAFSACALTLGLMGWLWVIPQLRTDVATQQLALATAQTSLASPEVVAATPPKSATENHLDAFYATLAPTADAEQQIKAIFAIANHQNLPLNLADYKMTSNLDGRYQSYQLQFPLSGSYAAIRQFCEQLLLDMPFASLDEISFKRDAINSPKLDTKLRITLYLTDKTPVALPVKQEVTP